MFFKKVFIIFICLLFICNSVCFAIDSIYVWSEDIETEAFVPTDAIPEGNFLELSSPSAILIEQNSSQVLYEHNSHEQLRPASVTKVMTLLLIMEAIDNGTISFDTKIPCSETAASMGGSQIWLDVREELSVLEMLKAICVVSANDCTVAMAEYLAGSEDLFVNQMNEKAKQLGMNDTTFKNCHGIDEDGHVTSSFDVALMSRELMLNHPKITEFTTIWMDTLRDGKSQLVNTNKLIRNYTGATGLKTGSTSLALYNLSATATKNNLSLIAVIMKSSNSNTRFSEAKKLLDYGFSTYEYKELGKKHDFIDVLSINKGIPDTVNAILNENAGIVIKKGEAQTISKIINLNENIVAPIEQNKKLGTISYYNENNLLLTCDVIAEHEIRKINFGNILVKIYFNWFTLIRSS